MERESSMHDNSLRGLSGLLETVVLAFAVTGIFYYCYFLLAPWIWSQNIPYRPEDVTPWILGPASEHDGVEIYALYILVFVNGVAAFILSRLVGGISAASVRRTIVALCLAVSCLYCATVGFIPPMNSMQAAPLFEVILKSLAIMAVVFVLIALLQYLQRRSPCWGFTMAALVLVPVCFIATMPISRLDYAYIFAPALRLLSGTAIRDIYFQYDLLPSLLAAGWMKLGLDLNGFQILGQAAYYIVILSVFAFSQKLFQNRNLPVMLLAALVLGRLYASPWDATLVFQVTPLRLDLWFPLLLVVYYFGPYHWSAGLVCGLLLLLIKNFGIIYTLAYVQLLITLFAIRYWDSDRKLPLPRVLLDYLRHCAKPLAIILCSFAAAYFLFRNNEYPNYSGYYQKIGIGFIRIASTSFYWYVPAVISTVTILLFRLRTAVSSAYLTSGFLLTYCAIGNSIYFFGRSHEHNILNIAIVLLFLLFFMLDLVSRTLNEDTGNNRPFSYLRRNCAVGAAALVIMVLAVSYSSNIAGKAVSQVKNVSRGKLIYPVPYDKNFYRDSLNKIKLITNNSSKVYFVGFAVENEFDLYYHGGYAMVGYCNPFATWIFTHDLNRFLQGLLDNGYYLVCKDEMKYLLPNLTYTKMHDQDQFFVLAKSIPQVPKR